MKIGGTSSTFNVKENRPYRARGTSIEKRLVRTSTLAAFVVVVMTPLQVRPGAATSLEKCIATSLGGAPFGAAIAETGTPADPNVTLRGTGGGFEEHPTAQSKASDAPKRHFIHLEMEALHAISCTSAAKTRLAVERSLTALLVCLQSCPAPSRAAGRSTLS